MTSYEEPNYGNLVDYIRTVPVVGFTRTVKVVGLPRTLAGFYDPHIRLYIDHR